MVKSVLEILKETNAPLVLNPTWTVEWAGNWYDFDKNEDRFYIENMEDGRIFELTIHEKEGMYKWAQNIIYGSPKVCLSTIIKRYSNKR